MNKIIHTFILAACIFFISGQIIANENNKSVAFESFKGTTLAFTYKGNFTNATITVSGPNGFNTTLFKKHGPPFLNLADLGSLSDGLYKYQISAASSKMARTNKSLNNGRGENARTSKNVGVSQFGLFRIKNGVIENSAALSEGE